jgi:hypothetical protein
VVTTKNSLFRALRLGSNHLCCCLRLDGERGRNRTFNLLIKSQLLCQLSYAPLVGMGLVAEFSAAKPCP